MKPVTKEVSIAYQALERDVGPIAAESIYALIKAVIVEQSLPDGPGPELWTAAAPAEKP